MFRYFVFFSVGKSKCVNDKCVTISQQPLLYMNA